MGGPRWTENDSMNTPIYQVDAFGKEIFNGNPAAVCDLHKWLDEDTLAEIVGECGDVAAGRVHAVKRLVP